MELIERKRYRALVKSSKKMWKYEVERVITIKNVTCNDRHSENIPQEVLLRINEGIKDYNWYPGEETTGYDKNGCIRKQEG